MAGWVVDHRGGVARIASIMKRIVSLVMMVCAVGMASLPAQLVFEKSLIERTPHPDDTTVSVDFAFKVAGDQVVEIAEFDAPCSCLEAKISDNGRLRWKPGESGVVKGVFALGTFTGTVQLKGF